MTILGQQQTHVLTRAFALLADAASEVPGVRERKVLWLRGFHRWWVHSGHLGELADPAIRERLAVQARLAAMLEHAHERSGSDA